MLNIEKVSRNYITIFVFLLLVLLSASYANSSFTDSPDLFFPKIEPSETQEFIIGLDSYFTLLYTNQLTFGVDVPVAWERVYERNSTVYSVNYSTSPIFRTNNLYLSNNTWKSSTFLSSEFDGIYENISILEPVLSNNFSIYPNFSYTYVNESLVNVTINSFQSNASYDISGVFNSISALPIVNVTNLTNLTNLSLIPNVTNYTLTLAEEKIVSTSLGNFSLTPSYGLVEVFQVSEDLEVEFIITNVSYGGNISVDITLPFALPEDVELYLWKTLGNETTLVPYKLSESLDVITLFLKDGEIDDDGIVNGKIVDPLLLHKPDIQAEVDKTNQEVVTEIISNGDSKEITATINQGDFASFKVVDIDNTINTPNANFLYQLNSFVIENVTDSVTLTLTYPEDLPEGFEYYKFNPNTTSWSILPSTQISSNQLQITLVDGGLGDDDGVKNGVIIDPSGVGFVENVSIVSTGSGLYATNEELFCTYDLTPAADRAYETWTVDGSSILVLYLPMDGNSSNALLDFSGNGFDATVANTPTWSSTGGFDGGGYFQLDATGSEDTSDYLNVAHDNALTPAEFTMSFWIFTDDDYDTTGNQETIWVGKNEDAGTGDSDYAIGTRTNGDEDITVWIGNGSVSDEEETDVDLDWNTGQWYHIAWTYNNNSHLSSVYRDGELIDSYRFPNDMGINSAFDLRIGSGHMGSFGLDGGIDEFMLFNRELSARQIKLLYTNQSFSSVSRYETTSGETWLCNVTGFNSTDYGLPNSTSVTITAFNQKSVTSSIDIQTSPFTNTTTDNLECVYTLADSSLNSTVLWQKNGQDFVYLSMPFDGDNLSALYDYSNYNRSLVYKFENPIHNATGGVDGNGAFDFTGGGEADASAIIIPNSQFTTPENFSIAMWINPDDLLNETGTTEIVLIGKAETATTNGIATDGDFSVAFRSSGIRARIGYGANVETEDTESGEALSWETDRWYHFAVTYDNGSRTMNFFRDGEFFATETFANGMVLGPDDLHIGAGHFGNGFDGQIDNVYIFDSVISTGQIAQLYENYDIRNISSAETQVGDTWACQVVAIDSLYAEYSSFTSVTITSQDQAFVENVSVTSALGTNTTSEVLSCTYDLIPGASTSVVNWFDAGQNIVEVSLPFEGGSTDAMRDFSGNNYANGTYENGAAYNATGGVDGNGAIIVSGGSDATGSRAEFAITELSTLEDFTFSFWINSNTDFDSGGDHIFISNQDDAPADDTGFGIGSRDNSGFNDISIWYGDGGGARAIRDMSQGIGWTTDTWYHIAVSYDNASEVVKMYRNGQFLDSFEVTNPVVMGTDPLRVGGGYESTNLNGLIDEVTIFNRVLSQEQIELLYDNVKFTNISAQETMFSDTWTCEAIGFAETGASVNPVNQSLTITGVTPAYVTNVNISSTLGLNSSAEDLICDYTQVTGNAVTYSWSQNGVDLLELNMPFEGGSLDATLDFSQNAYIPSIIGGHYEPTAGVDGNGSWNTSTGDGIFVNISSYPTMEDFTWSFWVNLDDDLETFGNTEYYFLSNVETNGVSEGGFGIFVQTNADDDIRVRVGNGDTDADQFASVDLQWNQNQWYHLAATYENSTRSVKIYRDGTLIDSNQFASHLVPGFDLVEIGGGYQGTNMDGLIDQVALFNKVLSGEQIQLLYNNTNFKELSLHETEQNDEWYCNVTGFDTDTASFAYEISPTLTIDGNFTYVTDVNITATSPFFTKDDDLTCTFSLAPEATQATIFWERNDDSIALLNLPFEGGTDSALHDYSGNEEPLTVEEAPLFNATGDKDGGGSFAFDSADNILLSNGSYINVEDFSWSFWVKPDIDYDTAGNNEYFFMSNQDNTGSNEVGFGVAVQNNGDDGISIRYGENDADALRWETSDLEWNTSHWYNIVVTYDNFTRNVTVYRDGVGIDSNVFTNYLVMGSTGLRIGRGYQGTGLTGQMDNILLLERALSEAEVLELYNNGGVQSTIGSAQTIQGDIWTCNVIGITSSSYGTGNSSSVTIASQAPDITSVDLLSSSLLNTSAEFLQCNANANAVTEQIAVSWQKDGSPLLHNYYPFEGNSSNALSDFSTNDVILTNNGSVTYLSTGGYDSNGAFEFDGTNYLNTSSSQTVIDGTNDFSYSIWVRPTIAQATHTILQEGDGSGTGRTWLSIVNETSGCDGDHKFSLFIGGASICSNFTVQNNTWHHVAVTVEENGGSDNVTIFVNGQYQNSTLVAAETNNNAHFLIGTHKTQTDTRFIGRVDEVRVYDDLLSSAQVLNLYNDRQNRIVSEETTLGETWQCTATAFNSTVQGGSATSGVMTIGSAPLMIAENVTVNATTEAFSVFDNLTCNFDTNALATTSSINWFKEDQPLMELFIPAEGGNNFALADYSGNLKSITNVNGVQFNATDGFDGNGSIVFNETNYLEFSESIIPKGAGTIMYWFKAGDTSNAELNVIVYESSCNANSCDGYGGVSTTDMEIHTGTDDDNVYFVYEDGTGATVINNDENLVADTWYHYAITYNTSGNAIMYRDGVAIQTADMTTQTFSGIEPNYYYIGRMASNQGSDAGRFFDGSLDDLRIYDYVLSPEQISTIYENNTQIIVSQEIGTNENWYCEVVPFNTTARGLAVQSNIQTSAEFANILNATISLPSQNADFDRYETFTINGTANCQVGDCGTTSAYGQYLGVSSPEFTITETTLSDFASNTQSENVTFSLNSLQLTDTSGNDWWDTAWQYRVELTIENINSESLFNYSVLLDLDNSSLGSNFDWSNANSLRIIFENETNGELYQIPHFVDYLNSTSEEIDVYANVPFIDSTSTATLWVYYGNSGAVNDEDPENTFQFFLNLSSLTVNGVDTSGTAQDDGSAGVTEFDVVDDFTLNIRRDPSKFVTPVNPVDIIGDGSQIFETRMKWNSTNGERIGMAFYPESLNFQPYFYQFAGTASGWGGGSVLTSYSDKPNEQKVSAVLDDVAVSDYDVIFMADTNAGADADVTFSNVRIRQFTPDEPSISAFSAETTASLESAGTYVSEIFDLSSGAQIQNISWSEQVLGQTTLQVESRTSADNVSFTPWFVESNGLGIQAPSDQYFQYRVTFTSSNSTRSASLNDITLTYSVTQSEWKDLNPADEFFQGSNPDSCGDLDQLTPSCDTGLSVFGLIQGNFSLRWLANSTDPDTQSGISDIRNISVYLRPQFASLTFAESVVARDNSVLVTAKLVDEAAAALSGYNVTFYDETANGTRELLGYALTDSSGDATLTYTPASDYTLGLHTINVSFPGSEAQFVRSAELTNTITVSSSPVIANITQSDLEIGYGYNLTITANVTDVVGLTSVYMNVTGSNGNDFFVLMTDNGQGNYSYFFNDSWRLEDYTYRIQAENSDGIQTISSDLQFDVVSDVEIAFATEFDEYGNEQDVFINGSGSGIYPEWGFRVPINITASEELVEHQVEISLDASNFDFTRIQSNGSDIRVTWINDTSSQEQAIDYWIEFINVTSERGTLWIKLPTVGASIQQVYLYYNNSQALDAQNGTGVFIFYDGFETFTGWTTQGDGLFEQNDSQAFSGQYSGLKYGLSTSGQWNDPDGGYKSIGQTIGRDVVAEFRIYRNTGFAVGGTRNRVGIFSTGVGGYGWSYEGDSGNLQTEERTSGMGASDVGPGASATAALNQWTEGEFRVETDGTITAVRSIQGVVDAQDSGTDNTVTTFDRIYIAGGYSYHVDDFRLRNYSDATINRNFGTVESVKLGISNPLNVPSRGYLRMITQRWTGTEWENFVPPAVDQSFIDIDALGFQSISDIWETEGAFDTATFNSGEYRVFAVLEDPDRNVLITNAGDNISFAYNFTIIKPIILVTNVSHEHIVDYSLNEYETQSIIDFINVTVQSVNNTAYDANITLSILDSSLQPVGFGPDDEVQNCGNIAQDSTCEEQWNNASNGYVIPANATPGTYNFFWDITMTSENGDTQQNQSESVIIHHIPSNISSALVDTRISKPNSTTLVVDFTNPWSGSLNNVNVSVNCPNIVNFTCIGESSGVPLETIGTITTGATEQVNFTVEVNNTVASDNYDINLTVNYTNPAGEVIQWSEIVNVVLEVRSTGILEITNLLSPSNVTRLGSYDLEAQINNTGDTAATGASLNYTLPLGWSITSGNADETFASIPSSAVEYNNITVTIAGASGLGPQTVQLNAEASDGRTDFISYMVDVYANTSLTLTDNQSFVDAGFTIGLSATLTYENGTTIAGQNITFIDELTNEVIGWNLTNSVGIAYFNYTLAPNSSLGFRTIRANYSESAVVYARENTDTTLIDVHRIPDISGLTVTPQTTGFGRNVTVDVVMSDNDGVDAFLISIEYPNDTIVTESLVQSPPIDYSYIFSDGWAQGFYNFTIFVNDTLGSSNTTTGNFTISSELAMAVDVLNSSYNTNELVYLTNATIPWWNYSFPESVSYNVTNDASQVTDYSLQLVVDTENISIQSQCQDIRFAQYNSTSGTFNVLEYWNETMCNTSGSTTYWVNVPVLEAGFNDIRLFFGNDDVDTTVSTPGDVFVFYDDFETFTGWTTQGSGVISQGSARSYTGDFAVRKTTADDPNGAYKDIGVTLGRDIIFEAYVNRESGFTGGASDRIGIIDNSGNGYGWITSHSGGSSTLGVDERSSFTGTQTDTVSATDVEDDWVFARLEILSSGNLIRNTKFDSNMVQDAQTSKADTTVNSFTRVYIFGGREFWVDDLRVRKYADVTVSELQTNELGSVIGNIAGINSSAHILAKVQRNDSGTWVDVETVLDASTQSLINISYFDLAGLWNADPFSTGTNQPGTYRVFVELQDDVGNALLNPNGLEINATTLFTIAQAETVLNITDITVYDISAAVPANRKSYTNDFVASGLNRTFNLENGSAYRFEISVLNGGTSTWDLNESTVLYKAFPDSWTVSPTDEIWYSFNTNPILARVDSANEGGMFNGTVNWNTTTHDGTLSAGSNVTFYVIIETTNTSDPQVNFEIKSTTYEYDDFSTLSVIVVDNDAPQLFNDIYNITPLEVIRGNDFLAYARWDETIFNASVRFSTTSPVIFVTDINESPQNTQNWTNFTISSLSTWYLGNHTAKIEAADEAGNRNDSLDSITFTVFGQASIQSAVSNDSLISVGDTITYTCRIVDTTASNTPLINYEVNLTNSTQTLGTNRTNSSGYVTFQYSDTTPGLETINCTIGENATDYYKTGVATLGQSLTTVENEEPQYSDVGSVTFANKGDDVELSTLWTDNYLLDISVLETNISGTVINESSIVLTGAQDWANYTYQIPTSMTPGNLTWRQYGNDSFGNYNITPFQTILVYGWSEVTTNSLVPSSMQTTNTTTMFCTVQDANNSALLDAYPVDFYYKNDTDLTYQYLGQNNTNASGISQFSFAVNDAGVYDVLCNITDTGLYNDTVDNSAQRSLNVVVGSDVIPPSILGGVYSFNETDILRNQCVAVTGLWDESINESYVLYNTSTSPQFRFNISEPYTLNYTNGTLCTDNSWDVGNYSLQLVAVDQAGNVNSSLAEFPLRVQGRSELSYLSPIGSLSRGNVTITCQVTDEDTTNGIEDYLVSFYDNDLGFTIGTNTTNSTGYATFTYDYSTHPIGPNTIICEFESEPELFYVAQTPLSDSGAINFVGNLNISIDAPVEDQILHRGANELLNSTVVDENENPVSATVIWRNSTFNQVETDEDTLWSVPATYPLGPNVLYANATGTGFSEASDNVSIFVYGYSEISATSPGAGVYGGVMTTLICQVQDNETSENLANYDVTFSRNGTTLGVNSTNTTGYAQFNVDLSALSDAQYDFLCSISDNATQYYNDSVQNVSSQIITVDTTAPTFMYNGSNDGTGNYSRDSIFVSVQVDDLHLEIVLLNWSGSLETFDGNIGNIYYKNKTSLTDGTYIYSVYANDTVGNENTSDAQTVIIDTTAPTIVIDSPLNQSYNVNTILLNYTASDIHLDSCWFFNGTDNVTLPGCNNVTVSDLMDQSYTFIVYANDTFGNQHEENVTFLIDRVVPTITIENPIDGTTYSITNTLLLNYTVNDNIEVDFCSYQLNGSAPVTLSSCQNTSLVGLPNGNRTLTVNVTDTAGNVNSTSISFAINISDLIATLVAPENNTVQTTTGLFMNVSTNEIAIECNYSLDGAAFAAMSTSDSRNWFIELLGLSETAHNVTATCRDAVNVSNTGFHFFTVDVTAPSITFVAPTPGNGSAIDRSNVLINITTDEVTDVAILEWTNFSGSFNFTMVEATTTNFYYNLSDLVDGTYNYSVYVNDSYGNARSLSQSVQISLSEPIVQIFSPLNQTYEQTVIDLEVAASKQNIARWWYVLNGENFSFTPNTTIVANITFNNLTVYAEDGDGLIGNTTVFFSFNGTTWEDTFDGYSGLERSTYANASGGARVRSCWPLWYEDSLPQDTENVCWQYRKTLDVTSGSTLSDYQTEVFLDLSALATTGSVQDSCADLRFTFANASEPIVPHWIEECNAGDNATVWLRMPEVNSTSQVYVYYGNAGAADSSNGNAVFEFFDDFSSMNTSKWGSNANNWVSESGIARANVAGTSSRLIGTYSLGNQYTTEVSMLGQSTSGAGGYYRFGNSGGNKNLQLFMDPDSTRVNLFGGSNNYVTVDSSIMQRYTIKSDFSNDNYTLLINDSFETEVTSASGGGILNPRFYSFFVNGTYVDWIGIRKFAANEPTIGSFGSVETAVVNATYQSVLIAPQPLGEWLNATADITLPASTAIDFEIRNASNVSICGPITSAQMTAGFEVCAQAIGPIYLYANLTSSPAGVSPTLNSWNVSWLNESASAVELFISDISTTFSGVAGDNVTITVNVSNSGSSLATNAELTLNITLYNGTLLDENVSIAALSIPAGSSNSTNFTWTSSIGYYNFTATIDSNELIAESDETNNSASINFSVSSQSYLFGIFNYTVALGSASEERLREWEASDKDATLYFADIDANYIPFNLQPLNGTSDFTEADSELGSTYYNDSLSKLFDSDGNGIADQTISLVVSGTLVSDIPYIVSGNSSSFVTGVLWDSGDGGSEYNGTQDLVFVTVLNTSQLGTYGTYDYEVALPVGLANLKPGNSLIGRIDEVR